jgi:Lrp/AsnC family leucine-responsive transcriptional regulator
VVDIVYIRIFDRKCDKNIIFIYRLCINGIMQLSLTQKKILELLSINCRFSNKDLGKAINISEDAVQYQINKLINKEKLARFIIQFDYHMLGYSQYHMWIKLRKPDVDMRPLMNMKELISINSSYGKYDLQIIALVKDTKELNLTLQKIETELPIQDMATSQFNSFYKPFTNIIPPISVYAKIPKNRKKRTYELSGRLYAEAEEGEAIKIDDIDKRIITELLKNPRITFKELSQKTKINHETIRYRINNYVKHRFIKNFGLLHDFERYGLYTTYFLLKLKNIDEPKFKEYLRQNENIFYSAKLTGTYNCIIYIVSSNPKQLGEQFRELSKILQESTIAMDLLFLEKLYRYVQFPEGLLDKTENNQE